MDQLSEKKLNEIITKEVLALTESEKAFLRARQSYLTAAQADFYSEVLESKPQKPIKEPNLNKSRSYRALQTQAKELGLSYIGVTREDLERSVDTAVGPK